MNEICNRFHVTDFIIDVYIPVILDSFCFYSNADARIFVLFNFGLSFFLF